MRGGVDPSRSGIQPKLASCKTCGASSVARNDLDGDLSYRDHAARTREPAAANGVF